MKMREIEAVKRAIRDPYAWPGGYPVYTVMSDGELLCPDCAKAEFRQIVRDTRLHVGCWQAMGAEILWESDTAPMCCHCNKTLQTAYRQHSLDATHVAWDVIEFDNDIPSYTVEHRDLTDRERQDFREMFLARHVYTD